MVQIKTIHQNNLSSECLLIQVWGPAACLECKSQNKSSCGGKKIRLTMKNEKELSVPVE